MKEICTCCDRKKNCDEYEVNESDVYICNDCFDNYYIKCSFGGNHYEHIDYASQTAWGWMCRNCREG